MGKVGRWIDGLSHDEKDRVVRATAWGTVDDLTTLKEPARCIVSHAQGLVSEDGRPLSHIEGEDYGRTGCRFDRLCDRFGLERIVRACKQRAAATMSDEVERKALPPAREVVTAELGP